MGFVLGVAVAATLPSSATVADARGSTRLISLNSFGFQTNHDSGLLASQSVISDNAPSMTPSGRYVAFTSKATNMDSTVPFFASVTDGQAEIYVRDRDPDGNGIFDESGTTTLASVSSTGSRGNAGSFWPALNAGTGQVAAGRYVAFVSPASNLAPETDTKYLIKHTGHIVGGQVHTHVVSASGNGMADLFVRDLVAGTTTRVSVSSSGGQAEFPHPPDFGPVDNNNPADPNLPAYVAYCNSNPCETPLTATSAFSAPAISADGRYIAYYSYVPSLDAGDTFQCGTLDHPDACSDLFIHDRDADADGVYDEPGAISTTILTAGGNDPTGLDPIGNIWMSRRPALSSDGSKVAFQSLASNLVASDNNGVSDIFLRALPNGPTTRISVSSTGAQIFGASKNPAISGNGTWVLFESVGLIVLGDSNASDIYARDIVNNTVGRVNLNSGTATSTGSVRGSVGNASISTTGRFVGMESSSQVYVRDRDADSNGVFDEIGVGKTVTRIASVSSEGIAGQAITALAPLVSGLPPQYSSGRSAGVVMSDNGLNMAFMSLAANLVAGDLNSCISFSTAGPTAVPSGIRNCADVFVRVLSNLAPFATAGTGLGICVDQVSPPQCPFTDRV
jgi:hypothetical protein